MAMASRPTGTGFGVEPAHASGAGHRMGDLTVRDPGRRPPGSGSHGLERWWLAFVPDGKAGATRLTQSA